MNNEANLRVKYTYDPESHGWCFEVPTLGIIGDADTHREAEDAAVAAIRFTLDDGASDSPPLHRDIAYVRIVVMDRAEREASDMHTARRAAQA